MSYDRCSSYHRALKEMGIIRKELQDEYPRTDCDAAT